MEVVPASGMANEDRLETVKSTVRKFFQRSDPDQKGIVSEERFRAFCRRSGLQEVLTASEIRTLMERLKKRRGKLHGGVVLDYERYHLMRLTLRFIDFYICFQRMQKVYHIAVERLFSREFKMQQSKLRMQGDRF